MTHDSAATFLFADIAGFTALTEAHGDDEAVQLVEDFAAAVQAELPRVDGEHVKTIGDALMLRIPDPVEAIRLGVWITREAMGGHQAPSVRVGGKPRLRRRARGRLLRDDDQRCRPRLGARPGRRTSRHGRHGRARRRSRGRALRVSRPTGATEHRGAGGIFSVVSLDEGAKHFAVDPVCKMAVDPDRAVGRLMLDEEAFHFCSLSCAAAFAQHPERYTGDRV